MPYICKLHNRYLYRRVQGEMATGPVCSPVSSRRNYRSELFTDNKQTGHLGQYSGGTDNISSPDEVVQFLSTSGCEIEESKKKKWWCILGNVLYFGRIIRHRA